MEQAVSYQFNASHKAWRFVRALEGAGIFSGFPNLKTNSVQVSSKDVDKAD
jgi:hypothetical protein